MTSVIIPNVPQEMVGDIGQIPVEKRRAFGLGSQRMLWYAHDGDVVVLPREPNPDFVSYVTSLTGTDEKSLTFVYPPPGRFGEDIVTADRLTSDILVQDMSRALRGRTVDDVVHIYSDVAVAQLAEAAGITSALAGQSFSAQGGDALANSKAVFRAVAAGNDVPIAPGVITDQPEQAVATIEQILSQGFPVMMKQQYSGGGLGNQVLSRHAGVRPQGAADVVLLADRDAVEGYVAERWDWLTGHHGHSVIIERFFTDAHTVYAEFVVTEEGHRFRGAGEILMGPVATGEIIPPQSIAADKLNELVELGGRLCEPYRAMGYRGTLCADAILTPAGEVYFTEVNGRLTASSHIHVNIIGRVVGGTDRVFLERAARWRVPSFAAALERLAASGLGYDPATRLGVIATADYASEIGRVTYCVVAADAEAAYATEKRIMEDLSDREQ